MSNYYIFVSILGVLSIILLWNAVTHWGASSTLIQYIKRQLHSTEKPLTERGKAEFTSSLARLRQHINISLSLIVISFGMFAYSVFGIFLDNYRLTPVQLMYYVFLISIPLLRMTYSIRSMVNLDDSSMPLGIMQRRIANIITWVVTIGFLATNIGYSVYLVTTRESRAEEELLSLIQPYIYDDKPANIINPTNENEVAEVCMIRDQGVLSIEFSGYGTNLPTTYIVTDEITGVTNNGNSYRYNSSFQTSVVPDENAIYAENGLVYSSQIYPYNLPESIPEGVYTIRHTNFVELVNQSDSMVTRPFQVRWDC